MSTVAQGIYQSTTERVDVLGVARDEADGSVVVYRVIDERREMRVMAGGKVWGEV